MPESELGADDSVALGKRPRGGVPGAVLLANDDDGIRAAAAAGNCAWLMPDVCDCISPSIRLRCCCCC